MALEIIWTQSAIKERADIFEYWNNRNKSKAYSKKLFVLFTKACVQVSQQPDSGEITSKSMVRMKLVKDYYIVYRTTKKFVYILRIWDTRRDPESLTF